MKDIKFVNAEQIESLEDYGVSLVSGVISLATLRNFHISAYKKGLLNDDENETSKTICWEIQRLISLYKTQIENVLERTEINEEIILKSLSDITAKMKEE